MANSDTENPRGLDDTVTLSEPRLRLASTACYEIEQLGQLLRLGASNGALKDCAVRGVCMRIEQLSVAICIALNGEDEEISDLSSQLGIACEVPA